MTGRTRGVLAAALGFGAWLGAVWLASRFVAVPPGSVAFWIVLPVTMAVSTLVYRTPGFHGDSVRVGIGLAVASWIGLGPMDTAPWPFLLGVLVVGACVTIGVGAAGMLFMGSEARGDAPDRGE